MKVAYSKGKRASKELILLNRQSFEASGRRKMTVLLKKRKVTFLLRLECNVALAGCASEL